MEKFPIVISASRMTDMPAFYPEHIIREIEVRKNKGFNIHSIVLWTKHVSAIFAEPLNSYLKEQQKRGTQLCVQLTITGIGKNTFVMGTNNKKVYLEPCVPDLTHSVSFIDKLIEFTGNPERIKLRVDPLIRLKDAEGNQFSNYDKLPFLINLLHPKGIRYFAFSFLEKEVYKKIDSRFLRQGLDILPPKENERLEFVSMLRELIKGRDISVAGCSVPYLPQSACIDGMLLQKLHDAHLPVDLSRPHSRSLCGCTKSVDIGGWPPKVCKSGCLYCYSRPDLLI